MLAVPRWTVGNSISSRSIENDKVRFFLRAVPGNAPVE